MKNKSSIWIWFAKASVAGLCALGLACIVCLGYYNLGVHITNKTGVTDYVWEPNVFTMRMTEGIAWDRFDKNGFCNSKVIDKNMDVLVMGSSHMEGLQVFSV